MSVCVVRAHMSSIAHILSIPDGVCEADPLCIAPTRAKQTRSVLRSSVVRPLYRSVLRTLSIACVSARYLSCSALCLCFLLLPPSLALESCFSRFNRFNPVSLAFILFLSLRESRKREREERRGRARGCLLSPTPSPTHSHEHTHHTHTYKHRESRGRGSGKGACRPHKYHQCTLNVLQCVAVCCSVLQCVAVWC